jgi:hypothetical protein
MGVLEKSFHGRAFLKPLRSFADLHMAAHQVVDGGVIVIAIDGNPTRELVNIVQTLRQGFSDFPILLLADALELGSESTSRLAAVSGATVVVDPSDSRLGALMEVEFAKAVDASAAGQLLKRIDCLGAEIDPVVRGFLVLSACTTTGPHGVSGLARALGVSSRTLERKLRRHGLAHARDIVVGLAVVRAAHLLAFRRHNQKQLRAIFPFLRGNSFTRYLKRFAGVTPRDIRSGMAFQALTRNVESTLLSFSQP